VSLLADPAVDEALQLAASPVAVQATLAEVASQFQAADHIGWEGPHAHSMSLRPPTTSVGESTRSSSVEHPSGVDIKACEYQADRLFGFGR
jgi:hypothetical protein